MLLKSEQTGQTLSWLALLRCFLRLCAARSFLPRTSVLRPRQTEFFPLLLVSLYSFAFLLFPRNLKSGILSSMRALADHWQSVFFCGGGAFFLRSSGLAFSQQRLQKWSTLGLRWVFEISQSSAIRNLCVISHDLIHFHPVCYIGLSRLSPFVQCFSSLIEAFWTTPLRLHCSRLRFPTSYGSEYF